MIDYSLSVFLFLAIMAALAFIGCLMLSFLDWNEARRHRARIWRERHRQARLLRSAGRTR